MNFCIQIHPELLKDSDNSTLGMKTASQPQNYKTSSDQGCEKDSPQYRKSRTDKSKKSYHWKDIQHEQYLSFLKQRKDLFDLPYRKKIVVGIHTEMSKFIKSRTPQQCRSHHQKMMIKYKSLENIIAENIQAQTAQICSKAKGLASKRRFLPVQQVENDINAEVQSLLSVSMFIGKLQQGGQLNFNMVQIMSNQFQEQLSSEAF